MEIAGRWMIRCDIGGLIDFNIRFVFIKRPFCKAGNRIWPLGRGRTRRTRRKMRRQRIARLSLSRLLDKSFLRLKEMSGRNSYWTKNAFLRDDPDTADPSEWPDVVEMTDLEDMAEPCETSDMSDFSDSQSDSDSNTFRGFFFFFFDGESSFFKI